MTETMQAAVVERLGEPRDVLSVRSIPAAAARSGQILVKVRTAALGFPDALLCRGAYQVRPELPFVPGAEVCGDVVDSGGTTDLAVGQRVAALLPAGVGGLAEYVLAPAHRVFAAPEALSDPQVAGLASAYVTAWLGLHRRVRLQAGETLVVSAAAGGVGSAAVQLGVAAGARVIAVTRGPGKVAVARSLGAHAVVDALAGGVTEQVRAEVGERGADVVFDPVGGETHHQLAKALAFGGRILVVGFAGGEIQDVRLNRPLLGSYSIVGLNVALHLQHEPGALRRAMAHVTALAADGRVSPLIHGAWPLSDVPHQLQSLADGRTIGRVVLRP